MFEARGPWLGQVRLVARPAMGNHMLQTEPITVAGLKARLPAQPKDAKSPREGCLFLGMKRARTYSIPEQGDSLSPAWEGFDLEQGLGRLTQDALTLGYDVVEVDAPSTMCPVVDPNLDPNIPTKLNEVPATAPCYEPEAKIVWACPKEKIQSVGLEPSLAPTAQTLPPGPAPDLVPVAAGAGVVAILAAVIAGAFGK